MKREVSPLKKHIEESPKLRALRQKRFARRRRLAILLGILFVVCLGGFIYATHLPRFEIGSVVVSGNKVVDTDSITAPGITDPSQTFISATNNVQTTTGVNPQPTIDQYVYQPLQSDGTLCTLESQECRRFNLYYRLEADNTVYMVTGKNL